MEDDEFRERMLKEVQAISSKLSNIVVCLFVMFVVFTILLFIF